MFFVGGVVLGCCVVGCCAENEVEEGRKEIDMEGVGEAGEEVEGEEVGDDEGDEEEGEGWGFGELRFEVGASPGGEEAEIEAEASEGDADEAELEEEADKLVLDDLFGGGDGGGVEFVHDGAGGAEAGADEDILGGFEPGLEGDDIEVEADVGRFRDVAVEDGGLVGGFECGLVGGVVGFWG